MLQTIISFNLLPSITNLLLILYLLFYPYKEEQQVYETLVKAFLVAGIFTGLIFLIYANNKIRIISFKGLLNRKLLSYSWQFFVANIFVALLLRSDIWLIKHLCTYADLGNYIQTTKISQFILLLPNLASFTLLPLLTQSIEQNMAESKVLKLINLYFYLALFIIVIFI